MSNFANLLAAMNGNSPVSPTPSTPSTPSTTEKETTNDTKVETNESLPTTPVKSAEPTRAGTELLSQVPEKSQETGAGNSPDKGENGEVNQLDDFLKSMKELEEQIPNGEFLADMMRNVISRIQTVPHIQEFVYKNTKHLETIVSAMHSASSVKQARTYNKRKKAAKKEETIDMTLDVLADLDFGI